jgi:DNA-binding HxlR family transcriptional regulator
MIVTDDGDEDRRRAEVFDSLGHPTRIMILKALSEGPMGFADLKKKLGIESSGHLQHHLNKLGNLVKTDNYGKYILSDQGKDAFLSVETVEKVAQSGAEQKKTIYRNFRKNMLLRSATVVLAILLVTSSALAIVEFNKTASLQRLMDERDSVIGQLQTKLNLVAQFLNIKPLAPHYMTTLPNGEGNVTKIFLESASLRYLGLVYQQVTIGANGTSSNVTVAIVGGEGGWYYVTPPLSRSGPYEGPNPITLIATVRNDYTPADAGNASNPNAPIGDSTSRYASFITFTVRLYSQNGRIIQEASPYIDKPLTNDYQKLVLGGGETTTFAILLNPSILAIDHYDIYVSYLSSVPQP